MAPRIRWRAGHTSSQTLLSLWFTSTRMHPSLQVIMLLIHNDCSYPLGNPKHVIQAGSACYKIQTLRVPKFEPVVQSNFKMYISNFATVQNNLNSARICDDACMMMVVPRPGGGGPGLGPVWLRGARDQAKLPGLQQRNNQNRSLLLLVKPPTFCPLILL